MYQFLLKYLHLPVEHFSWQTKCFCLIAPHSIQPEQSCPLASGLSPELCNLKKLGHINLALWNLVAETNKQTKNPQSFLLLSLTTQQGGNKKETLCELTVN